MKNVVVVMTHYDRRLLLERTLLSLASQRLSSQVKIIVVDDGSVHPLIQQDVDVVPHLDVQLVTLHQADKKWHSPDIALNVGFQHALNEGAEIVIVQNAECIHVGEVLEYAAQSVTDDNYVTFGCLSLDEGVSKNIHNEDLELLAKQCCVGANQDGQLAWYNHPLYRPVAYEFCAAITTKNILKLNGYDERFAFGWGYSDNYWLARVRKLGLKVEITAPPQPFVIHQWHPSSGFRYPAEAIEHNRLLYNQLYGQLLKGKIDIRAQHIITENLK